MTASSAPGVIAMPAVDWMWTASALALVELFVDAPDGTGLELEVGMSTIAAKRTSLVRGMLRRPEAAWILFLDSDMVAPPDTIARLLAHDVDVVGGLYVGRQPPHAPKTWRVSAPAGHLVPVQDFTAGPGLVEVDATGTGCLLVRRRVFEVVSAPWFVADPSGVNEDVAFCRAAQAAGFSIYCDTSLSVGHVSAQPITLTVGPIPEREERR